jgi:Mrp family chromosome partitioning ATPase
MDWRYFGMSQNIEVLRAKEATELFGSKSTSQRSSEAQCPVRSDSIGSTIEGELVQRVFLLPAQEVPRVVVFCRVGQIEGAAGICARAGQNLANQTGSSVCVVDGDFRSPSLHLCFGLDNSRGFTDAVFESGPIRDFVRSIQGSNLSILSSGSRCGRAPALCKLERLRSRIAELRQEFSFVLVYGPQGGQQVDAMLLGQVADGVILILESMVTRRETARATKENLASADVKILGAVLHNHNFSIPETLYRRL